MVQGGGVGADAHRDLRAAGADELRWQRVPNSFDAVEIAYMSLDLLTKEDYAAILLATQ